MDTLLEQDIMRLKFQYDADIREKDLMATRVLLDAVGHKLPEPRNSYVYSVQNISCKIHGARREFRATKLKLADQEAKTEEPKLEAKILSDDFSKASVLQKQLVLKSVKPPIEV